MDQEQDALSKDKLDELNRELSSVSLEGQSLTNLCKRYREVKPFIIAALPFIGTLPKGEVIVATIRYLMTLGDNACAIHG